MAEYKELIERLRTHALNSSEWPSIYGWAIKDCNQAADAIEELAEKAQPERQKGEWEEIEVIAGAYDISGVKTWASKMKCDQCGFTTIAIEGHFSQYNFCPNCGADMRGGKRMKIVIDIPNWLYNAIMDCEEPHYSKSLGDAVRDGTPLPKGCGRLGDLDALEKEMVNGIKAGNYEEGYEAFANINDMDDCVECVKYADTIIEADKGEAMNDLIRRQDVLDYIDTMPSELTSDGRRMIRRISLTKYIADTLPSAQPELIEKTAYIRGFEQGRTQGMIDSQGGKGLSYGNAE